MLLYADSVGQVVKDIKSMKIQGARSIAIAGLKALKEVVTKDGFGKEFGRACRLLETSRPTGVALHNAIESIKRKRTMEEVDRMIYYFENASPLIASRNYNLIKNGSTVLTHCHSSVVVEIMKKAWDKKINFRVVATETRPLLQGKKTAKELSGYGIPVVYTDDVAFGHLWQMHKRKISMVLLGVDAIRKEGVVNKVGSYVIAVFAKENMIPVYFVGELMKIDKRKAIEIEERNPEEIISQRELPDVRIENVAFDITPWKYITGVVTEKGILKPREILRRLKG
jgi:ribose 1,5-bisphosphate isomerase